MFPNVLKKNSLSLFLLLLLLLPLTLEAQKKSRAVLEKEKKENLKRIHEADKILFETKVKKEATVGQLNALKNKIQTRENLIKSVSEEVALLEEEIQVVEGIILQTNNDIDALKSEYANMVYSAAKLNSGWNKLMYVFSSESVAQLSMRVKYFQHYAQLRQEHLVKIQEKRQKLEYQYQKLQTKLSEKNRLIGEKTQETVKLTEEKQEQNKMLDELSEKEKALLKEQEERKKAIKKLETLITDLIEAERKKAIEAAKKAAAKKAAEAAAAAKKSNIKVKDPVKKEEFTMIMTPEAKGLSNSFAGNEAKLPWPVLKGSIAQRFGKQPHPVLKGVFMDNLGVDIQTTIDQSVRAVFQGKVITVAEVPGMNKVVMIQHGEYFTVYAKLKSVTVKTGDELSSKEQIGVVYNDKDKFKQLQIQKL